MIIEIVFHQIIKQIMIIIIKFITRNNNYKNMNNINLTLIIKIR